MINFYGNTLNWIPQLDNSDKPLYIQISESIEQAIRSGTLVSGFKLPPQRVIAHYLGINHSTVTRAYKLCEEKGLLKGVVGKGTFVSSTAGIPNALLTDHQDIGIIEMGMTLPVYETNVMIEEAIKSFTNDLDYSIALQYVPPEGHIRHRHVAAQWLGSKGISVDPQHLVITAGAQNALAVILSSQFKRGDRLAVDELSFTGLTSLANNLGIILVGIPGDAGGMSPEALSQACIRENIKGIYLIPDNHNPTTVIMAPQRRTALAEIIEKNSLLLIEDGTFRFTVDKPQPPISTLIPKQGFYIHGTSKALCPSTRIAYVVTPREKVKSIQGMLNTLTWMSSPLCAEILAHFQLTGAYDKVVETKRKILKERNALADRILEGSGLIPSTFSLYRYLELPKGMDDTFLENQCLKSGLQVFSSKRFVTGIQTHNGIRLAVSGPKDLNELERGLLILKQVLADQSDSFTPIL